MAENKTKQNDSSVKKFLDSVPDETKRKDSYTLVELMQKATGEPPKMWGPSIVGFGSYHYKYASGREGDSPLVGFSPRKQYLTLYVIDDWDKYKEFRANLGKHSISKSCLYIKRLSDVNMPALKKIINAGVKDIRNRTKNS
jgi:hypothetical protein